MRDIRIRRTTNYRSGPRRGGGIRSAISSFSTESKRRLMFAAGNYLGGYIMLTLTYPSAFPLDGRIVKDHWRRMPQWLVRQGANPKHLQAGTRIELFRKFAARGSYVMKYAAKMEQKTVPAEF